MDNVSIAFGSQNQIFNQHFGFFTDRSALIEFGAETKLIASGTKYIGVDGSRASGLQLQGKLTIEGGDDNEIVGINGGFTAIQPLILQINSQYTNTITGITGGDFLSGQPMELQIDAQNSIVTAIKDKGIRERINITKFIAKEGSYILKNTSLSSIDSTISVGSIPTTQEEQDSFAIYSDLEGAKYSFMQSSDFDRNTTTFNAQDNKKNYYGIFAKQGLEIGGNIKVRGKGSKDGEDVKNIAGIYAQSSSQAPISLSIQDDTNLVVINHYNSQSSGSSIGIAINQTDTTLNVAENKKFALHFQTSKSAFSKYVGFYVKGASFNTSSQNLILDANYDNAGEKLAVFVLDNGSLQGSFDFYVDASYAYAWFSMYGVYSKNKSLINSQIIFRDGFFKKNHPTHPKDMPSMKFISNEGELTFGSSAVFFAEDPYANSNTYLINNTGSIVFQSGAKAIFGQEYAKLSEITQEGIYLAKDTGNIYTTSMTFKGNAGIGVAGGATLNMTLSSGTLEFNGSNGSQEMVAFNALQSSDTSVAQGKINLTINKLNSSIIFTKAQGGVLETLESLMNNPTSSVSTDKNTIVNLAGIAQDSSQSREVEGKLATRSLTIKNANIKNVNFITYVNPNISTSNVEITNFNGRAYSNPSGDIASFGASDRIIIENSLENSGNNTFSIAIAPNQSTKNMSGYMLIGKVKTSSNLIFNDLQNGGSKNITAYSGLRTTTLTLHRSDVGGYSYYYVTSAQDSTTPTPPSGGGGVIPPIDGGDNENNGNNGQTLPSPTPLPDEGNEGVTPPPSNDNNTSVGDDVIDVPNVGVAPLTRSAFKTNFTLISSTLNSLNKRLGDIRSLENADGVWARVFVGEEIFKDTLQTNAFYTSIQAGYDHAIELESDTDFIGFALAWVGSDTKSQEDSYQVSPIDFINGKNTIKTNGVELALYNSYLSHLGLYTDNIIKFGYYSSDVSMPMMESFALDDFSFSLSQEVGYQTRLGEKKEWVITPQVEVAYAFITGSEATQNLLMVGVDNVMDISQSASHLLRMRAGVDWGYSFDGWSEIVSKADIHLGTSYEYDVISGGDMTYSLPNMGTYKERGMDSNGRFVLNIGTNIYIKETASIYFDFEKSFGDTLYKNYQANLGARFSFGEKIHKLQDEKTQSAPLSLPEEQQSDMQDKN